jgi:beta-glucosidase
VVQLYVRDVMASVVRPIKELKAFTKVSLAAGRTQRIALEVPATALAFHDRSMRRVVEPGEYEVQIGSSSADIRLRDTFFIDA